MYEWSLVAECDAVLEIWDDNRVSGKKRIIIIIIIIIRIVPNSKNNKRFR